jgi:Xaa-Pro aminopeptidase
MRIEKVARRLELALLVTSGANIRYLTGLHSSNAAVLVEPDGSATVYTDFRYAEKARALEGMSFVETSRYLFASLAELLSGRRVAFEEAELTVAAHRALADGSVELVPTAGLVEGLRVVKDEEEIVAMRDAAARSDELFTALASQRFVGRTARELSWWIEGFFREGGADQLAFPPIVAGGVMGASPHADPGETVIEPDTLVTVDAGCVVDGYCSDCTRTFATGSPPKRMLDAYELCRQAQLAGLDAVRPGVSGRAADAVGRKPIEDAGLGWAFGHGLGHGVGIEVHEAPVLRPESTDVLEAGSTVTVEPGIYLPGEGGVRIEDLVLVTAEGCERLTQFPKELITVA